MSRFSVRSIFLPELVPAFAGIPEAEVVVGHLDAGLIAALGPDRGLVAFVRGPPQEAGALPETGAYPEDNLDLSQDLDRQTETGQERYFLVDFLL